MTSSVRHISAALAGLVLVLASIWAIPPRAYACGCIHDNDDPALVDLAEVIFTGTVIDERSLGYNRTYTFAVTRVYKGSAYAEQRVQTRIPGRSMRAGSQRIRAVPGAGGATPERDTAGQLLRRDHGRRPRSGARPGLAAAAWCRTTEPGRRGLACHRRAPGGQRGGAVPFLAPSRSARSEG